MSTHTQSSAFQVTVASSSRSTVVTNLFEIPTGACSIAVSIANLVTEAGGNPSAEATSTVVLVEPVSNPDIAGLGILIAFLATAYGIFLWMLIAYFCRWLSPSLLGQVDKFIFRRPARRRSSPQWWQNAVHQSILAYADIQIVTGVGILVAAFSTMSTLSVYHYQVAMYLAWMSSNTHLTAVSLLQIEFRNKNRSVARRLRLGGMGFLAVMLLVALVPTASYNWVAIITRNRQHGHAYTVFDKTAISSAGVPARCFWQRQYSGGLTPDAMWSFVILVFSYTWKGLLLFQPSQQFLKVTCRRKMLEPLQKRLDQISSKLALDRQNHGLWLTLHYKMVLCSYVAVWALFELTQSFVMSLWICGAGLVWGSLQILVPRAFLPSSTLHTESTWTFGQVLPIILLAVPIMSFAEGYMSQKAEVASQCKSDESVVENSPGDHHVDEESILSQTNAERHASPQVVKSRKTTVKSTPEAAPAEGQLRRAEDQCRPSQRELPWRCDERIYKSRFIKGAFYGSQLGVLALGFIFVAYHFLLFIPKTISDHSMIQATLATDYGIWFLVGCTVVGWLAMVVLLLLAGATFSSLFKIEQ